MELIKDIGKEITSGHGGSGNKLAELIATTIVISAMIIPYLIVSNIEYKDAILIHAI